MKQYNEFKILAFYLQEPPPIPTLEGVKSYGKTKLGLEILPYTLLSLFNQGILKGEVSLYD